ncbi:lytic polysaccharide monooxygenase [Xylaria sp. FL0064]|nr:lytic polysaccharide monooxygenase [Xylaria sp. FL0064]
MHFSTLMSSVLLIATTSAHTIFCQLKTDHTYAVSYGIRTPSYDGPQTDVNSANLACNGPPNPTTPSSKIIDVKAGSTVNAIWRHTLQSGANDVMDAGHKGPVMAYLQKVVDATQDSGVGSGWFVPLYIHGRGKWKLKTDKQTHRFKIQESGFSNGVWGTDTVINSGGNQQIHIPDCIEDGQYLLRAEMIALHGARSVNGAQLYMECAQINITGGKATKAPATASIPGIYKSNDPGLLIDIYNKPPSSSNPYKIPGPALFTC